VAAKPESIIRLFRPISIIHAQEKESATLEKKILKKISKNDPPKSKLLSPHLEKKIKLSFSLLFHSLKSYIFVVLHFTTILERKHKHKPFLLFVVSK